MEEWREQRGSVEEGVKTALERLDPEEEGKLKVSRYGGEWSPQPRVTQSHSVFNSNKRYICV